ncbi:chemotaxis protein [Natrinema mahii]|nr:chemotaxis protein [Natrinema mahii]
MSDYLTDFVQESEERITELNNALLTLERDPDDEEAMEQIFRIAHTLKGNCGAMGLESASDLAHAIEDLLDAVRGGDIEVTPELMDVVFDAVDELETMIDEVAADGEIETDPSATIEAVREYLEGGTDATPAGLASPTPAEIDEICSRFAPPTDDDRDVYLARLEIAEREGVNNGKLVVDALIDAFELMGTDPSQDRIEADEYDRGFDAVFATAVGEAAIASGLEPVEEVDDFEIVDVDDRFEAAPADEPDDVTAEDISSADAQDLEVDELLDEFDEFDNLDEMVEDVEDEELDAFEDMGEAGSFDDLLDEEDVEELEAEPGQPPADHREADAASGSADAEAGESAADDGAADDEVDDASAVFDELKDEVEMVGFDELQDELAELEFDEFDEEEEVDMDDLLGEEADDESFLEGEEPTESAVDDMLVDAEADAETEPAAVESGGDDADDAADAEQTTDTDAVAAPASDDLESGAERAEPSFGFEDEPAADEPATGGPETEPGDDAETAPTAEPTDEPATAGSPEPDEGTAESADTEADEPAMAAEPDEPATALEKSAEPDDTAAPDADGVSAASGTDDTDLEAATTDRPDDEPVAVDDAPADDAGVTDADTGTDLEEATDTATAGADTVDDVEADAGLETADADGSATDTDADAADDSFGDADGFETADDGFETADDGFETADADAFGDESIDAAADSFGDDDAFEVSADSVDLEDETDAFGGFDDDIDDGLEDDAFDDTDEFDVGTDFGMSTEGSASGGDSSFGDDADDDEDEADVVRIVEEPEFEIPDVEVPDTDVQSDADDEADEIQSVRVDVEQVDSLLNLVEGLVTSRVRLRHAAEADDDNDALETELDALSDLTTDLQETVMDIRLVPLRTVTNRLPRVVRDIAREQDKEVAFEMTGEDVELDRSILDRIGDPLIHLVRNAVDHGIEPPAEREAADKPSEGSVEVRADRESDRVTITVEDDGGGLDPDRLRDEAVEAGVLEPEVAAELPDEDAYDLIFHPGLSTAKEVTDVSGRGVGMDVVKRTVEDLEGTVSIDSEAGVGTTVTMELPVTVAIDEILFVESGGEEFGVPTKAVRDIESAAAIETASGESILPGEEGDYPVVSLADVLETPAAGANGNGMVVRIRDDVREVALHCDRVSGQQEVVVKPFEGFMSGVPGISGATVRGRGEVVNILDVTTL